MATTDNSPSVAVYNDNLWIVWRGTGDQKEMFYVTYSLDQYSVPEINIVGSPQLTPLSCANPGLAWVGADLLFLYKSSGKDARLFYCTYNDQSGIWRHDSAVEVSGNRHWPETDFPPTLTNIPSAALTGKVLRRRATNNWTSTLPGDLSIGTINLPGSHDSVAKRLDWAYGATLYGTQSLSITAQLERGIRLFDIRIRVVYNDLTDRISLEGCHSKLMTSTALNAYRPRKSYADEMNAFLIGQGQTRETIVVILKIDDDSYCPANKRVKVTKRFEIPSRLLLMEPRFCRHLQSYEEGFMFWLGSAIVKG